MFDEDQNVMREQYECECGGTISFIHPDKSWQCDSCDFDSGQQGERDDG